MTNHARSNVTLWSYQLNKPLEFSRFRISLKKTFFFGFQPIMRHFSSRMSCFLQIIFKSNQRVFNLLRSCLTIVSSSCTISSKLHIVNFWCACHSQKKLLLKSSNYKIRLTLIEVGAFLVFSFEKVTIKHLAVMFRCLALDQLIDALDQFAQSRAHIS